MSWSPFDHHAMARALRVAARGRYTADPNPRVGCVLAKDDQILAEGWHERAGAAHAERRALEGTTAARGGTCYVSLEPCTHRGRTPPCTEALIEAGVARVVVADIDPNPQVTGRGIQALRAAGVRVTTGLMQTAARDLNPGFHKRMEQGLPWVRLKLAMSLDGRTALANGRSQWISSAAARRDVHRLRAGSSALITGIGTVLADNPRLTVRDFAAPFLPPLRVVLDSQLRTPGDAKVLQSPGRTLVFTCRATADDSAARQVAGAEICQVEAQDDRPALDAVLRHLASAEQINEVLVEAGSTLAGAFMQSGCVDELVIYVAPKLLGDQAQPALRLPEYVQLPDCPRLTVSELRQVGTDLRLTARPMRGAAEE